LVAQQVSVRDRRMSRRSGIRFADKDMRQQENRRRFPVILDHRVIQYRQEALQYRERAATLQSAKFRRGDLP
jgi:hypothetical protein